MIIVNIEKYGDYDIPYTALTMVAPEEMGKKQVSTLVKRAEIDLSSTNDEQVAIKYLKDWGFTVVKTFSVAIGGDF